MTVAIKTSHSARGGNVNVSNSTSTSAKSVVTLSVLAPKNTTTAYEFAYEATKVQHFSLLASRDCTVHINDTADAVTPFSTHTMKAGRPLVWDIGDSGTDPLHATSDGVYLVVVDANPNGADNDITAMVAIA